METRERARKWVVVQLWMCARKPARTWALSARITDTAVSWIRNLSASRHKWSPNHSWHRHRSFIRALDCVDALWTGSGGTSFSGRGYRTYSKQGCFRRLKNSWQRVALPALLYSTGAQESLAGMTWLLHHAMYNLACSSSADLGSERNPTRVGEDLCQGRGTGGGESLASPRSTDDSNRGAIYDQQHRE